MWWTCQESVFQLKCIHDSYEEEWIMGNKIEVNAIGDQCPIPVVKAKKAIDHAEPGSQIVIHVDNEIAVQNLTKMARSQNCDCVSEKAAEKHYLVTLTCPVKDVAGAAGNNGLTGNGTVGMENTEAGGAEGASEADSENISCYPDSRVNTVVVISSATMGTGNDQLGKVLMKGFIYALSQLEQLPKTILFYNGGVTLTTEGSDSLEDLRSMEAQGVEILSCGTCLNYYGLSDKLMVGDVTNMYSIVEVMAGTDKIIKP